MTPAEMLARLPESCRPHEPMVPLSPEMCRAIASDMARACEGGNAVDILGAAVRTLMRVRGEGFGGKEKA